MKIELDASTVEQCMYAARDGVRLHRRLRREVKNGTYFQLSVEECTTKMKEYEALATKLQLMLPDD